MAYYRLYLMSPRNGHIESFEELEAHDDDDAIRLVSNRPFRRPAELWTFNRKVKRFEVEAEAPARPPLFSVAG